MVTAINLGLNLEPELLKIATIRKNKLLLLRLIELVPIWSDSIIKQYAIKPPNFPSLNTITSYNIDK